MVVVQESFKHFSHHHSPAGQDRVEVEKEQQLGQDQLTCVQGMGCMDFQSYCGTNCTNEVSLALPVFVCGTIYLSRVIYNYPGKAQIVNIETI